MFGVYVSLSIDTSHKANYANAATQARHCTWDLNLAHMSGPTITAHRCYSAQIIIIITRRILVMQLVSRQSYSICSKLHQVIKDAPERNNYNIWDQHLWKKLTRTPNYLITRLLIALTGGTLVLRPHRTAQHCRRAASGVPPESGENKVRSTFRVKSSADKFINQLTNLLIDSLIA